ncbi:hypothetical protein J6590_051318 [Homalodisca vitripennis]|nr:hypothetical protein J6590_051318 [Homalodisca vitripennis]
MQGNKVHVQKDTNQPHAIQDSVVIAFCVLLVGTYDNAAGESHISFGTSRNASSPAGPGQCGSGNSSSQTRPAYAPFSKPPNSPSQQLQWELC